MKKRNPVTRSLMDSARDMRQAQSPAEQLLWRHLRKRSLLELSFLRQYVIAPFIADFYCPALRLVTEVDGAPHRELEQQERDAIKDVMLLSQEYTVIRIPARMLFEDEVETIERLRRLIITRFLGNAR